MLPKVSVVIPVRNEEKFIERAIRSILDNDYPKELLEVIVVNGMSEDGTREILKRLEQEYSGILKVLDNPKKITPVALNIGIKHATGDVIIRMDAHSDYPRDYISKCVKYLLESGADNVGGIFNIIPRSKSPKAIAIARVLAHPLGTGGARFKVPPDRPMEVETVPYGCFRRETFEKYGLFNEHLARNQDIEHNLRIIRSGGKVILYPDIVINYYARDTFKALWRNNFSNGYWVIRSLKYAKLPARLRHFVPLLFVLFLTVGPFLSILWNWFEWVYLFVVMLYFLSIFIASAKIAIREKSLTVFFHSIASFIVLHLSYGLGSLWALLTFWR